VGINGLPSTGVRAPSLLSEDGALQVGKNGYTMRINGRPAAWDGSTLRIRSL
jgi:hypothetical protein